MEDSVYLTTSKASLASLGSKLSMAYYNEANSSADAVEQTCNWSNAITLNSSQFGGNSQVLLPIDQFIGPVVLHLRLPATTANQTLPRGWGYQFLQYIQWTMGASSTTAVVLQGSAIWGTIAAQVDTAERRSELFRAAGEEQLGLVVTPAGQDQPLLDAYVLLPLPFSVGCGSEKLMWDSSLLSNNISIQIGFNQASSVYGGSDAVPTSGFLVAEVLLRQSKLSNQSSSLRALMVSDPSLEYRYPFTYAQQFSAQFTGYRRSDNQLSQVTLNSFANADLTGIALWAVRQSDAAATGGNSSNWINTDYLSDVLVTFNGSVLFRFNGPSAWRLTNLMGTDTGSSQWQGSVIAAGVAAPFISTPKDMYMIYLDFSRIRSACTPSHLQNVFRIPNQNLIVTFNTQYSTTYTLHGVYYYNGLVQASGGTSSILIG